MSTYLLLRDHIQLGPYSLEEMKVAGIRTTDLIWINGISTAWRYPDEIEELQACVYVSSADPDKTDKSKTTLQFQPRESPENEIRHNGNGKTPSFSPQETKIRSFENKNTEREDYEENISKKKALPVINRYPGIKKYNVIREESPGLRQIQDPFVGNQENNTDVPPQPKVIKVVIADDHTLFREGVKMALLQKKDVKIVGEAENGLQLLHLLKHTLPDVILLDIQMPIMDGIDALTAIRKDYSDLKVIMLSMYNDHSMVSTLMGKGANAYLTKSADSESIYEAIKTCYSKSYYFNELTNISMLEKIRDIKNMPEKTAVPKSESLSQEVYMPDVETIPDRSGRSKIRKQVFIATGSILLITTCIMVVISLLKNTTPINPVLLQSSVRDERLSAPVYAPPDAAPPSQPKDNARKTEVTTGSLPGHINKELNNTNSPKPENISPAKNDKELNEAKSTALPSNAPANSNNNPDNIHSEKKYLSENTDKKAMTRTHLRNLVTAYANNDRIGTPADLSNIKLTIYNQTFYKLDQVNVEVKYVLPDTSLYTKETMLFKNVAPLSSVVMEVPNSSVGVKIEYRIISIKSRELDL